MGVMYPVLRHLKQHIHRTTSIADSVCHLLCDQHDRVLPERKKFEMAAGPNKSWRLTQRFP